MPSAFLEDWLNFTANCCKIYRDKTVKTQKRGLSMGTFRDLTGQKFGRLTAISRADNRGKSCTMWRCRCDCGNEIITMRSSLVGGKTKSCGCLRVEDLVKRSTKHGMSNTRLYREWESMRDRCFREKCRDYPDYGGRGITVCDEWKDSFEHFRDWSLANGYQDNLTIDRKDNDGPYSPDNCRLATLEEQANNKRNNLLITYCGKTQTLTKWAEEMGMKEKTLWQRLKRNWPIEKALTQSVKKVSGGQ